MDIFVYSDESGVFDYLHNDWFVFGGLVLLGKAEKDNASRLYIKAEKDIRNNSLKHFDELKASVLPNKDKSKLYRSLNHFVKFGAVVNQKKLLKRIFASKKDKQRYLDYVYKIAVKRCLQSLMNQGRLRKEDVDNIFFFVDEHTTATNGRYELREGLEQEFKWGTYNSNYSVYYSPIIPQMKALHLEFCNSASKTLIRAADIVANRIFYCTSSNIQISQNKTGPFITRFP